MSGSSLVKFGGDEPKSVIKNWLKGAKLIGCTDDQNSSEDKFTPKIVECLRNSSPEKLISIPNLHELSTGIINLMSIVVIDGQFLPKKPQDLLRSGKFKQNVNLLIGNTEDEGSPLLIFTNPVRYNPISPQNMTYTEALNELIELSSGLPTKLPVNGKDVAKLYFTGLSNNSDYDLLRRTIGIAIGDFAVLCPTIQFAKTLFYNDRNSNVYQYYFNSKLGEDIPLCGKWMGVCHGSDNFPVFGIPFREYNRHSDREREISQQMIQIFSHFAKTGLVSIV